MRFCWWPCTSIISGGNVGAQTGICDYFGGYAGEGSRTFWALKFWQLSGQLLLGVVLLVVVMLAGIGYGSGDCQVRLPFR